MYRSIALFFLLLFLLPGRLLSQPFPQNYFRNPLDSSIILAGSFGELRPNHFHTGLDIKTGGVEGMPVYAAADGYVSHISISGYGYGNMMLVAHPNGYTTLYGHLQRFAPDIQQYTRDVQYKTQKWMQEVDVPSHALPVKKGQLIGYSGNSGSSRAPHLHFEIRQTEGDKPVNPLFCGFKVKDTIPPVIYGIKIYPLDSSSYVKVYYAGRKVPVAAGIGKSIKIYVRKVNGRNYLSGLSRMEAVGRIGFAIDGNDFKNNTYNSMGIYSEELCVNESRIYYHNMRILDFDLKRFINAHIDYAERMRTGRWFEKSFILPGDILPIYKGVKENGILEAEPGNTYKLSYYVQDENDNVSTLIFNISSPAGPVSLPPVTHAEYDTLIPFDKTVTFSRPGFMARFPANTFYENIPLKYSAAPKPGRGYSKVYEIGDRFFAVGEPFRVGIYAENLHERLRNKAFIYSFGKGYIGGEYKNGWILANSLSLGKFYITVDTIPPTIIPLNIRNGKNMSRERNIRFMIRDNLAGLDRFDGYVDGQWILFQYDPRIATIWYDFDSHVPPGKHELEMVITDREQNVRRMKFQFFR